MSDKTNIRCKQDAKIDVEAIDGGLGQHLSADPRIATADGRTEVPEP